MRHRPQISIGAILLLPLSWSCAPIASVPPVSVGAVYNREADADVIRNTERERLRSLVDAKLEVARRLHADDSQLVNPSGGLLSKAEYLGDIASGQVDYLYWEPETIAVHFYGPAAVIRYRSQLEIVVQGQKISRRPYWHIDLYEKRNARWQIVWSQATEIR